MTFDEIRISAEESLEFGLGFFTLVIPSDMKMPKGFPRGELLCVNSDGNNVKSFDAKKILKWLGHAETQTDVP